MAMYLLVDAGNSSIKWNVFDGLHKQFQCPPQSLLWRTENPAQSLAANWGGLNHIDSVLIANVAGQAVERAIQPWLDSRGLSVQYVVTEAEAFGVRNAYKIPTQLGVDRWLGVLAAVHLLPNQPVCVLSCGTAITIDSANAAGEHLGGLIAPGLEMMKGALMAHTHGVKIEQQETLWSPFTDSTSAAVNNGVVYAGVGLADRAISDIESRLGGGLVKIITGGDAQLIQQHSRFDYLYEPELVIKGLALYADNKL